MPFPVWFSCIVSLGAFPSCPIWQVLACDRIFRRNSRQPSRENLKTLTVQWLDLQVDLSIDRWASAEQWLVGEAGKKAITIIFPHFLSSSWPTLLLAVYFTVSSFLQRPRTASPQSDILSNFFFRWLSGCLVCVFLSALVVGSAWLERRHIHCDRFPVLQRPKVTYSTLQTRKPEFRYLLPSIWNK